MKYITEELVQDCLTENIENAVQSAIDNTFARLAFSGGEGASLPNAEDQEAIIKLVLEALAQLPGKHWLPGPGDNQ